MPVTTRAQEAKARTKTCHILQLSTEIQLLILHHLLPSIESIHAVAKTCKKLYDVALNLTVHTFRYLGGESRLEDDLDRFTARTMQFVRYVTITKPHLAQHVKCVVLGQLNSEGWGRLSKSRAPKGKELALYIGLIERTLTEADGEDWKLWRFQWLAGLAKLSEDAEVALLLVACPNIEVLLMEESFKPEVLKRVIHVAGQRSAKGSTSSGSSAEVDAPLRHLKELYMESGELKYGHLSFSEFAKAFQIPSLRSFEVVRGNGEDYRAGDFEDLPKRSSNVEEIILRSSCITPKVLKAMTAVPRALVSFEYTMGLYHMYDEEMKPRDLVEAMVRHAASLEYLHINTQDDWPTGGNPETFVMGLGLRRLTALKQLAAGMQALTGTRNPYPPENENMNYDNLPEVVEDSPRMVDCLPENLEFLQIHACGKPVLPHAQELFDARAAGRFPRLRHVRLLFNKELISSDDIDLHYDEGLLRLEVYLQSDENRFYDLIQIVDEIKSIPLAAAKLGTRGSKGTRMLPSPRSHGEKPRAHQNGSTSGPRIPYLMRGTQLTWIHRGTTSWRPPAHAAKAKPKA
ncbi:uncharacterized protein VDAG_08195 [Verticillium dahliae VdLs.17]|uniref:Leucine-rich repeat domain-containing protein n=1 Tax=Verticillium dahliae (strain VdLs.17 / ATCC MYA-4575 / FGSC 10137) TaxID=498257 RepID=G2XDG3_VERDV|nr:uncharacterized protein VDAG_08195 [Verticillium dahliae VdLs.17]EGY17031.1 hypothetical protein VDAG_08195 [Verticillium dahliae VdLs.17]